MRAMRVRFPQHNKLDNQLNINIFYYKILSEFKSYLNATLRLVIMKTTFPPTLERDVYVCIRH